MMQVKTRLGRFLRPWRWRPWPRRAAASALLALLLACTWLQLAPLPAGLLPVPWATLMLDRHGQPLAARIASDQQWRFAPVEQLPNKYQRALLTYEDHRFFWHPGVDPIAVTRAAWQDLRAGHIVSGGSTISMQLARLLRHNPPRTWGEKLREAWLALHLEARLSKPQILIQYASRAPYGGNTVGLRAAAWRYFQRPPGKLSWAEAALLAVMPNNPSLINSARGRKLLHAKRDRLLDTLAAQGDFDAAALRLAKLEPLPTPHDFPRLAPRLMNTLIQQGDGPLIRTTLDAHLQRRLRALANQHGKRLAKHGVHNLAVVIIDHRDLTVRAYLGNLTHGNRVTYAAAVDVAASPRSTGSILKPFLYGLMLDAGLILPDTLVPDLPTDYGGYTPENYDRRYRGAVPARMALARSLNVPAVRMLRSYGVARFDDQLQTLGMSTLFRPADQYGLTLILGGAEGRLDELTGMYARLAAMAGNGKAGPVRVLQHGKPQDMPKAKPYPISPGAAWLTLKALREVARPGTARQWRLYSSSQPIAWKTGTSYGLHDAWAIGSNGRYTVGVWTGNANSEPAPELIGSVSAAPLMLDTFSLLGNAAWPAPPSHALKQVRTCTDDGYLAGGLCPQHTTLSPAPRDSHFEQVTPNHLLVHLDANGQRVHSGCESVARMHNRYWFVLPPGQAYFYRQHHPDYQPLPAWRSDCVAGARALNQQPPMALIYPHAGTSMYIPRQFGGARGKIVFRAVHRRPGAKIYWHLDDRYLGVTSHFHEWALRAAPGWHTLTLVDDRGFRLVRRFKILGD